MGQTDGDLVGRHARSDELDRRVQPLAALLVCVELGLAGTTHAERPVVAGPVAHERVDDVEEGLVPRAQQAVGEDVRVGVAAVAGDGVDGLHLLGAELEQEPLGLGHDLVLADPRAEQLVDPLIHGVDDRGGVVEQRDLVHGLDLARGQHHRLGGPRPGCPRRCREASVSMSVRSSPSGSFSSPLSRSTSNDVAGQEVGHARLLRHRAAHARDPGAPARLRQPGGVELVVLGGGAEVPEHRVALARQQNAAGALVARPLADVRARDVADVVLVEQQHGAEVDARSASRAGSRRSLRRRGKSTRCSQSTAMVAPREAIKCRLLLSALAFSNGKRLHTHRQGLQVQVSGGTLGRTPGGPYRDSER